MTEDIVEIIARYGLETILIAVAVNILTALIKLPIKYLAGKTKNSARITRFIVVLPLIIGFGATVCYMKLVTGNIIFGRAFITLWLTSSSLSLTIYAVLEKMLPSKKSIVKDSEAEMTEKIIEKLQTFADGVFGKESADEHNAAQAQSADEQLNMPEQPAQETESSPSAQTESVKKIVLRGNGYVQTDVKE